MKPEELRIGNWVNSWSPESEYKQIRSITMNFVWCDGCQHFDLTELPIPLTEEWLLKFGFSVPEGYPLAWGKGRLRVNVGNQKTWLYGDEPIIDIKHVHQLQNLYFALTGEELKQLDHE